MRGALNGAVRVLSGAYRIGNTGRVCEPPASPTCRGRGSHVRASLLTPLHARRACWSCRRRVVLFAFPSGQIFVTLARISPGMAIMFSLFGRKRKKSSEHLNREIRLYPIKLRQLDDIELICAKPHAMLNFGVSLLVKDKGLAGLTTAIETLHALIERQVSPSVCYFSSGSRQTESLCIATPLSDG